MPSNEITQDVPVRSRFYGLLFPLARGFAWLFMLVFGPMRVVDRHRVPRQGPLLIISNHLADIDPIAVQLASPRPLYFMAKSELFEMPVIGKVIAFFGAFPVRRGEPDRAALKQGIHIVQRGDCLCIFPEGQLSETGELQPLLPGAALIARSAEATVICCALHNTNRIMPYGRLVPRLSWRRTTVRWGEPRKVERREDATELMAWATAELKRLLTPN